MGLKVPNMLLYSILASMVNCRAWLIDTTDDINNERHRNIPKLNDVQMKCLTANVHL